jgi:uncharacterized protein YjbI with pentapeptide repeats
MLQYEIKSHVTERNIYKLPYKDLKKRDLREMNFTCADLRGMDLSGSDLSGSNLTRADLTGANLTGCDLTGCYVLGCKFDEAKMIGVKGLDSVRLDFNGNSGFYRASWKGCDFHGVCFDWLDVSTVGSIAKFFEGCKNLDIPKRNIGAAMFGV